MGPLLVFNCDDDGVEKIEKEENCVCVHGSNL